MGNPNDFKRYLCLITRLPLSIGFTSQYFKFNELNCVVVGFVAAANRPVHEHEVQSNHCVLNLTTMPQNAYVFVKAKRPD